MLSFTGSFRALQLAKTINATQIGFSICQSHNLSSNRSFDSKNITFEPLITPSSSSSSLQFFSTSNISSELFSQSKVSQNQTQSKSDVVQSHRSTIEHFPEVYLKGPFFGSFPTQLQNPKYQNLFQQLSLFSGKNKKVDPSINLPKVSSYGSLGKRLLAFFATIVSLSVTSTAFSLDDKVSPDNNSGDEISNLVHLFEDAGTDSEKLIALLKLLNDHLSKNGFEPNIYRLKVYTTTRLDGIDQAYAFLTKDEENISLSDEQRQMAFLIHSQLLFMSATAEEADAVIEKGLAIYPQHFGLLTVSASAALTMGNVEKAMDVLNKLTLPGVPDEYATGSYIMQIKWYRSKQNMEKAMEIFGEALRRFPNSAELWTERAISHMVTENLNSALDDFERSISLLPSSKAYLNRAYVYLAQIERLENDQQTTNQMLKTGPLADVEKANQVGEIDDKTPELQLLQFIVLGKSMYLAKQFDQAIALYQNALRIRFRPDIYIQFLNALLASGRTDTALSSLNSLLTHLSTNPSEQFSPALMDLLNKIYTDLKARAETPEGETVPESDILKPRL